MFGGGGMNPRKMKQMMKQMGIDVEELDADEVVVRMGDEELVFDAPQVTRMDAQGQQTYQIVGEPETREAGAGGAAGAVEAAEEEAEEVEGAGEGIPAADIEIVAQRTGASEEAAKQALEETDGDLAAAVSKLE